MKEYYSVKMRSSLQGRHISGAERIVLKEDLPTVISQLSQRPKEYDFLNIKVEKINDLNYIEKSLNVKTINVKDWIEGNKVAVEILQNQGVDKKVAEKYINLIHQGAVNGENMRGAMIVNLSGERVEKDKTRGIRTVNIDFDDRKAITELLKEKGYTERTVDALALATKTLNHPDIVAEYCISDDPSYTTGYVATKTTYYRINPLKQLSNEKGGRIYFVKDTANIEEIYQYLESKAFLIKHLGDLQ
ncbi:6-carboxyhexanoate--CoA ligase [Sulfurihydrogenibium azorense]|uniref:6-carboxyhexanoate--CoA ligase n=1 Tax=Sulfurihydrogenibium azorense TaxID=309806 RepID=UPI002409E93B|nr:6-carboxyhexanoate--CoA ligase [Sulfurihydrogenibium azorense]MDM7273951.1 6-carboxyhexanoate--CoA ligase [Sulfurihydrogenibium azorense]